MSGWYSSNRGGHYGNRLYEEESLRPEEARVSEEDHGLDNFDRQVLGLPPLPHPANQHGTASPRVSLPRSSGSAASRRNVIGDASHHFRPFMPWDTEREPQFVNNFSQSQSSPATQSILGQDPTKNAPASQPKNQLIVPSYFTGNDQTQNPRAFLQSSSPSELGASSPSARFSVRNEQPYVVSTPQAAAASANSRGQAPVIQGANLVNPRRALPDKCRSIFPFELFNVVQSQCFPLVYGGNDNVVISAPTGSGKTAVMELAICKLVTSPGGEAFKIVYLAPTKSLCVERVKDWEKKFNHINLKCAEITGDTSQTDLRRVGQASIIVSTPEKWDSITRKWQDHKKLINMVKLVLIDEVHMLKDGRGATLEVVVSRMKTIATPRFIALSATVPNIEDIAAWLGKYHGNQQESARSLTFGEELRPVKLKRFVYGYESSGNEHQFEKSLDRRLLSLLEKHSEGKPIMVFCFTRKSCEQTAQMLAEWWSTSNPGAKTWPAPTQRIPVINKDLQEIVRFGVSFHHAGLDPQDRIAVESNFLQGQLHVICCTSTLAVGVNLPCHTVVLKGTMAYTDKGITEYSDLEVIQMLGRAGRPQFDSSATAIIMTYRDHCDRYEKMIAGKETLESTLHLNLVEHINSEIGLGTITDLASAKKWICGTFLNVRMRKDPERYNGQGQTASAKSPDDRIREWCERDIKLLQEYDIVTTGSEFGCTEYGNTMSRYMIQFETMKLLIDIPRAPTMEKLLTALSKASEFKDIRFKPAEKAMCKTMNKEVMYCVPDSFKHTWQKVSVIVQIHLGRLPLPTNKETNSIRRQVGVDKNVIFDRMNRLVRCFIDCKLYEKDAVGVRNGLDLARALAAESWEGQTTQIQQVQGIGPVGMRKLIAAGIRTVAALANSSFETIERIMSRNPPYGMNVLKVLEGFPRLTLQAEIANRPGTFIKTPDGPTVTIKVRLGYTNAKTPLWRNEIPAFTLLVATSHGNLAHLLRNNLKAIDQGGDGLGMKLPVALQGPDEFITVTFSCEEIVGTQVTKDLHTTIPASQFFDVGGRGPGANKHITHTPSNANKDLDSGDHAMLDDDELADEDILQAFESADGPLHVADQHGVTSAAEGLDEHFPGINEILGDHNPDNENKEPAQMANGKWKCNHHCSGGAPTKAGKQCTHRCCHQGLDKPRAIAKKKRKESCDDGSDHSVEDHEKQLQGQKRTKIAASQANQRSSAPVKAAPAATPSVKAARSVKATSSTHTRPKYDSDANIECIDLSLEMEDSDSTKPSFTKKESRGRQELLNLHKSVQRPQVAPRLTKPYKRTQNRGVGSHKLLANSTKTEADEGESHYDSDVFGDEGNFSLLDVRERSSHEERKSPTVHLRNDQTLCPGIMEAYKESMENDTESVISFTTASEIEKAYQRLEPESSGANGAHDESSISGWPRSASSVADAPSGTPLTIRFPVDSPASTNMTVDGHQPFPLMPNPLLGAAASQEAVASPTRNEPAWLSEFDPSLVDMFRGCVDFVDD